MLRGPGFILLICFLISCHASKEETNTKRFYNSELFRAVQLEAIFPDSKTFVDLIPKLPYPDLEVLYLSQKNQKDFSLKSFVNEHFYEQSFKTTVFSTDTSMTMIEHIEAMWPQLTRGPDSMIPNSSRIALPYSYVVPGGRFQEIYYWDSYFTLEGLLACHKHELAKNMVDNFSFLIDSLGHIPNGTRNYYLSRSQPPFFSLMVDALSRNDAHLLSDYLSTLKEEYQYFMDHDTLLKPFTASKHVVKVADDGFLNRYFDSGESPRPEAFKEDFSLASVMENEVSKKKLYNNLRSAAESGWDFSSRWFSSNTLSSTVTTSILPVDLNCLLYHLELQLSKCFELTGDSKKAEEFQTLAETRKKNILRYFWNEDQNFFTDYDFTNKIHRKEKTLAGVFPLYFGLATEAQAEATKKILMRDFLKDGGLVTTLKHSGEQWDAPNGWAPLQWMAVKGLLKYGYKEEAQTIMKRWLALNKRVFKSTGKMMEKYNVVDISLPSGGGEYETQDGFGWTNGVALGFKSILERMKDSPKMK